jgi:hypothetical protein
MNSRTANLFRTVVTCIRANGGSTRLSRSPKSLIDAGLVEQVQAGSRGAAGCKARFGLTEAGKVKADEMFPVRLADAWITRVAAGHVVDFSIAPWSDHRTPESIALSHYCTAIDQGSDLADACQNGTDTVVERWGHDADKMAAFDRAWEIIAHEHRAGRL